MFLKAVSEWGGNKSLRTFEVPVIYRNMAIMSMKQGTELAHARQTLEVVSGLFFRHSTTGNDVKHFNFEPNLMYEKKYKLTQVLAQSLYPW